MNLNIGDKLIWIEEQKHLKGYVKDITNIGKRAGDTDVGLHDNDSLFTIHWDNGRTINYTPEQITNMEQGHYSGVMILDTEAIREEKLKTLGI